MESLLPETRCIATKALLNTFPNDAKTNAQLAAFRSQCAGLMTLNPLAQADFIKCFDQWTKEKLTRRLYCEALINLRGEYSMIGAESTRPTRGQK